jgi:dTMP kinase
MIEKGVFIAIDGGEGSYKTGAISVINDFIISKGIKTVLTREPGGTPFAEKVRSLLLAIHDEKINENTELLMMYAARSQHVENLIKPSLADGNCVITDRFSSSTIAYQCFGRGISRAKIDDIERIVLNGFCPDITIIMDVDPEIGLKRARARGALDRIELENLDFFKRVRQGYLAQANDNPERFFVVDASGDFDSAKRQILDILTMKFPEGI